jgi:DNA-binding NtrC family response regulator
MLSEEQTPRSSQASAARPAADNKGRILVVEDEVNARAALVELLREEGYVVEAAADAFAALDKVATFSPDLVLTDLTMPGMDGLQLLARLQDADPDLPAVLVTASGAADTAVRAGQLGARDCLVKPVNMGELSLVLEREMEQRRLRAQTRLSHPQA